MFNVSLQITSIEREFLTKDVYNLRTRNYLRNYLLPKLENHERKEPIRVEDYTIEHVMPQTLSEEWQSELGESWREIHEKYLHTIGNLTLTGYNSELSNNTFIDKQLIEGGFLDSPLRLNRSLAKVEQWNETAIVNRARNALGKGMQNLALSRYRSRNKRETGRILDPSPPPSSHW